MKISHMHPLMNADGTAWNDGFFSVRVAEFGSIAIFPFHAIESTSIGKKCTPNTQAEAYKLAQDFVAWRSL